MAPAGNFLLNDNAKCKVVAKASVEKKHAWRVRKHVADAPWYMRSSRSPSLGPSS